MRTILRFGMLLSALIAPPLAAQSTTTAATARDSMVFLRIRDGSTVVGSLARESAESLWVVTGGGRLTFAKAAIRERRNVRASDVHDGEYWAPNPHDTRLFFGPTARMLDAGDGYFSDFYLFFVNGSYGVTDRVMFGGGMSVFPSSDFSNNVFYLTPKLSLVKGERFNVAAGALVGFAGHANGSAGLLYVTATNGDADDALTYGLGWAYSQGKIGGDATLMLGGTKRVSRRVMLMTENYFFTGSGGGYVLPMYGIRFVGDRLSTDLGFLNFVGKGESGIFPGIPWVGFALKF